YNEFICSMDVKLGALIIVIHCIAVGVATYDLTRRSRRNQKFSWFLFLLLFPLIGVGVYVATMKRRKPWARF
ncbi:MAG: hypothetical protein HC859_03915, partial [Bacteroidia bacterium]|nr:hypothetical protein [Bacteroidia bacterium]